MILIRIMRIEICHTKEVDRWIAERHYLGYSPCGARIRMFFYDDGNKLIGAMMWGRPTARKLNADKIMELTRMFFINETENNVESKALAVARKYIRIHYPEIKGVLAYSSISQGHQGTIYLADGWFPFGKTKKESWNNKNRTNRRDKDISPKLRFLRSV